MEMIELTDREWYQNIERFDRYLAIYVLFPFEWITNLSFESRYPYV